MDVTIKDIAKLAGCSHTLVSQVLRGSPNCRASRETRMKILRLSCELNYRPNRLARRLRGGSSGIIFVLGRYCPAPGHQLVISVITEKLSAQGCQVFQAQTTSDEDTRHLIGEFTELGGEGIISCYTHYVPPADAPFPSVILSDYDAVPHDLGIQTEAGSRLLTQHLVEHGRRRIGFVGIGAWSFGELYRGIEQVLDSSGIRKRWKFDLHFDVEGLTRLLKVLRRDRIDALICQNDYVAGKLIAVLAEQGIRVPDDVAVVGSDAMSFAEFTRPPLTSTIYPYRELGEEAAALMLARIRKTPYSHRLPHLLKPELFIGGSCGCAVRPTTRLYTLIPPPTLREKMLEEAALRME